MIKLITDETKYIYYIVNNMLLKPKDKQLALIASNLAEIYNSGITIDSGVDLLEEVIDNRTYKKSLNRVSLSLKEGKTLSDSFKEFYRLYPELYTGIISVGENNGKLYYVLNGLGNYYEKISSIKKELINASIYPGFILISIFAFLGILINNIIPNFYEIYNDMNIIPPKICMLLYKLNILLRTNSLVTAVFLISWGIFMPSIICICLWKKLKNKFLYKIKLVNLIYEYLILLLLSIIISSGVNISSGLIYCEKNIKSIYIKEKISKINENILNGCTLSEAMKLAGNFSKYTLSIIRIREESGNIEKGLIQLSYKFEEAIKSKIKRYLATFQPALVTIMGTFVLIFVIFIILPLFDSLKYGIR